MVDAGTVQVLLRWLLQQDISAIPKAATNNHIINNLHVLEWELSDADMQQLSSLEHQVTALPPLQSLLSLVIGATGVLVMVQKINLLF